MKKLIFKVMFKFGIMVAVLLTLPYVIMGGKLPDWASGVFSTKQEAPALPENLTSAVTDQEVSYYQWVDDQGLTHFSSTPPEDRPAEQKQLRPDTNIVQAVKIPEEEESGGASIFSLGSGKDGKSRDGDGEAFNPYSPEGVQKLIDDAKNVATQMEKRNGALDKIMGADK